MDSVRVRSSDGNWFGDQSGTSLPKPYPSSQVSPKCTIITLSATLLQCRRYNITSEDEVAGVTSFISGVVSSALFLGLVCTQQNPSLFSRHGVRV